MAKRQIRGKGFDVTELVTSAIDTVDCGPLDTTAAREKLLYQGHNNPSEELVNRYARESAILAHLQRETDAMFSYQIGKIDFSTTETAVKGVNAYLNRRIQGQRSRWGK